MNHRRTQLVLANCLAVVCSLIASSRSHCMAEDKPILRVGSKSFTESVLLGELIAHLGRAAGAEVEHRSELGGTQVLWQALQKGDIDVYVDYTGTIREELLSDAVDAGEEVRSEGDMRERIARFNVIMSDRIGFNNTYALGMRDELAEELNIKTISDLIAHPELKLGLSDEFMEREDGWHQLAAKYQLPHKKLRTMDHNLAYRGLEHNAIQITDLYTTDAEIEFYNLRTLEDDRGFFPTYYATLLIRDDLKQRASQVLESILRLENLIDPSEMIAMTSKVRLDRQSETNVAAEFLNNELQLNIAMQSVTRASQWGRVMQRLARTTYEHLFLVLVSLTLAIAVAIPLGIAAARSESLAHTILGIVGVIQTLPSMALLVFMIPLFGLGPLPAIAALFFYSLLPIVRNTYTGLTQIPVATRESAEVLGLGNRARLTLVEFPLALPSILAGIKTAAVINVGTATIGAFIGAGGYGAPILTGIRLSNLSLILQGAVPAACLAIAVQYLFSMVEARCVSPGLRNLAK